MTLRLAGRVDVSVQRTRRLVAPSGAPKSYGRAALAASASHAGEILVGTGRDEGFWLGFTALGDAVTALRVVVEAPRTIDAISGSAAAAGRLAGMPQNYLVCPLQSALDGVYVSTDCVTQFVTSDGSGGACSVLALTAVSPAAALPAHSPRLPDAAALAAACAGIRQVLVPDPYGVTAWDEAQSVTVRLRFPGPDAFLAETGIAVVEPLDESRTYQGWRLP